MAWRYMPGRDRDEAIERKNRFQKMIDRAREDRESFLFFFVAIMAAFVAVLVWKG